MPQHFNIEKNQQDITDNILTKPVQSNIKDNNIKSELLIIHLLCYKFVR